MSLGTFFRFGGVSPPPFSSLNVGSQTEDREENVRENRRRVQSAIGVSSVVYARQNHGDRVHEVRQKGEMVPVADALWTDRTDIALAITHADCQAALFYDPVTQVLGAAHAGWRGTALNIYGKLLDEMVAKKGVDPCNVLVAISPSLGPCHAEMKNFSQELPSFLWKFRQNGDYFDFWEISRWQLLQRGILPCHIEIASLCTMCESHRCFSYRKENTTGRMVSWIAKKPDNLLF